MYTFPRIFKDKIPIKILHEDNVYNFGLSKFLTLPLMISKDIIRWEGSLEKIRHLDERKSEKKTCPNIYDFFHGVI